MPARPFDCERLARMDDERLFKYFSNNTKRERNGGYSIRFGSRPLASENTQQLWEKFKSEVRVFKVPPVRQHLWRWVKRHGKSILGCARCGVRKIKSNESHPCPSPHAPKKVPGAC